MRKYEITYLISDEVPESEIKKVSEKITGFIVAEGGIITKEESWGRRKLAYPIAKQTFATYITVWFELQADKTVAIDHEIRVYPPVIRHLTIAKTIESKELSLKNEEIAESGDVKEIVGEKSAEVIEGQTEESYSLMSKRNSEDSIEEDKKELKVETKEAEIKTPEIEEPKAEKIVKESKAKKKVKTKEEKETESERIKKLDEKLDELLKDDL